MNIRKINITKYISLVAAAVVMLSLGSCVDDMLQGPQDVPEGEPALLTLNIAMAGRAEVTRADVPDYRITSYWIGIFDAASGKLKASKIVDKLIADNPEGVWEKVEVETTSGRVKIRGVANLEKRYALDVRKGDGHVIPFREAIESIESLDDYDNFAVTFTSDGEVSIEEPLESLVMSGVYSEEYSPGDSHLGKRPEETVLAIPPGSFTSPGCIHLRRLISQNIFNIRYDRNNIKSMKITGWSVHNVPNSCWLTDRGDDWKNPNAGEVVTINGKSVEDKEDQIIWSHDDANNLVSFNFWMIENRHTGLEPGDDYTDDNVYSYREKEFKNADGTNTGKFVSLAETVTDDNYRNNATYVTFSVQMEMNVDENGRPLSDKNISARTVLADYTVHLGYCEGAGREKAMDFRCRRNSRYTYNVTVNNVNSMIVEANGEEIVPSLNGSVTDITDTFELLDSHYNEMNVYFTREDLEKFQYYMVAFDQNGARKIFNSETAPPASADSDFKFYSWVQIRKTTGQDVLAEYRPLSGTGSDGETMLLHQLDDGVLANGETGSWFTVFIDEYVYEQYDSNGNISAADRYNWHWYADAPDRQVWLNVSGGVSSDKETMYHHSKYAYSQRSIQTYYDMTADVPALAMEHVNESRGLNVRNTWNNATVSVTDPPIGYNPENGGRYIMLQYILGTRATATSAGNWNNNIRWNRFIDFRKPQKNNAVNAQNLVLEARTHTLPAYNDVSGYSGSQTYDPDRSGSPYYVNSMSACLNRNRDLDGDGYIDANEIRWFIPSTYQNMRLILGRQALRVPMMDFDEITYKINADNGYNTRFMLSSADGKVIWVMEGMATSNWTESWLYGTPWSLRCVRYLGSDLGTPVAGTRVPPVYRQDPDNPNIIRMVALDYRAIRQQAYRGTLGMPAHILTDQRYNRCYHAFEISDNVIVLDSDLVETEMYFSDYLNRNNPCGSLNKDGDAGWRVPNQKELTIMSFMKKNGVPFYQAGVSGVDYLISCSLAYFDRAGNPYNSSRNTSSESFRLMKIRTRDGGGTQGGGNGKVPDRTWAVRCVRDVE